MFQYLLRLAKRSAILIPGIIIAYFSVETIYPYFNRRVPAALAIFVTYVLGAYVLIPALIRLYRIVRPADHLPVYCVTPDGFASDPLNIGIIGTRRELILAMEQAGWYHADPHTWRNVLKLVGSVLFDRPYHTAPVSSMYLFGRKQDIAFELPVEGGGAAARHHVRFWATTYESKDKLSVRSIHWHHRKAHVYGDSLLWVGAASLDVGISLIRHNMQLTHMVDPDTNLERRFVLDSLRRQKLTTTSERVKLGDPYRLINRVLSGHMIADGSMTIVRLRPQRPKQRKSSTA